MRPSHFHLIALLGLVLTIQACSPVGLVLGAGARAGIAAVEDRGVKGTVADTEIELALQRAYANESWALVRDLEVTVRQGRVLLTGGVTSEDDLAKAARLAWTVDGVTQVINEVEVIPDAGLADYAKDSWIATKVRTRLLGDAAIDSVNYAVRVVNRTVYLFGTHRDTAEAKRAVAHARDVTNVRRVVDHTVARSPAS